MTLLKFQGNLNHARSVRIASKPCNFLTQVYWHEKYSIINELYGLSFLSMTHTNLIVHESFQALDKFMLVPFIDTLLPETKKHRKVNFDYMIIPWNDKKQTKKKITHRWDIIGDHLLFLVQKLLQSIQEKTKTLMTKVINPTRKKTQTNIEISYVTFIQNCYCSAGLL